jgi:hypothetical protein
MIKFEVKEGVAGPLGIGNASFEKATGCSSKVDVWPGIKYGRETVRDFAAS